MVIFIFLEGLTWKVVWRYALAMAGGQYVMRCGMILMLVLSVGNLDYHLMVKLNIRNSMRIINRKFCDGHKLND